MRTQKTARNKIRNFLLVLRAQKTTGKKIRYLLYEFGSIIPPKLKHFLQKMRSWWTFARVVGAFALAAGLFGAIRGPIPYLCNCPNLIDFHRNTSQTLIGIGLTVLVIDAANEHRALEQLKAQLIREMGSRDNVFSAVRELKAHGWFRDGSLRGAELSYANLNGAPLTLVDLQDAMLGGAKLQRAVLNGANLQGANLSGTQLDGASLKEAILQQANLISANATNAILKYADLQNANLSFANLRGADLKHANLTNVSLTEDFPDELYQSFEDLESIQAIIGHKFDEPIDKASYEDFIASLRSQFDEHTRLPDGQYWESGADMKRFTDPNHPDFWRSEHTVSGYLGNKKD